MRNINQYLGQHHIPEVGSAGIAAFALLAAGCSTPANPNRPSDLRYVTLTNWHIDPGLQLTTRTGAVAVAGAQAEASEQQTQWDDVVVLEVSGDVIKTALRKGDTLAEAYTGPGGDVHVGNFPKSTLQELNTTSRQTGGAALATLVGPNDVRFQLALVEDGKVLLEPTRIIGEAPIPIGDLSPGTLIVASPLEAIPNLK